MEEVPFPVDAMSALSATKASVLQVLAIAMLLFAANDCVAQQPEQSLFVIKKPTVEKTEYGQKPNAIRLAKIAQEDETAPREDLGQDTASDALKELDKFEPLDDPMDLEDENELLVKDDDDDLAQEPDSTPMTTWNLKPMSSITANMRPVAGKTPQDQSWQLTRRGHMPHANSEKVFAWAAPDIRYNPLYFEDIALERYGQTRGFLRQPFVSGAHFLKSATFLPYYSLYDPVNSCDGPLGYCRPGVRVGCAQARHYFGNPFRGSASQGSCSSSACTSSR